MKRLNRRRNGFNPYDLFAISKNLNFLSDQNSVGIKILDPYTLTESQSPIKTGKTIERKFHPDIKIKL